MGKHAEGNGSAHGYREINAASTPAANEHNRPPCSGKSNDATEEIFNREQVKHTSLRRIYAVISRSLYRESFVA